ncbi:MAG: hypothetical protein M0R17_04270 [Candidatus Omnitrophica bacterium]|jgi:hypothetical protein|nr:hypothetical protein [Candidatus Omnitrophota bacterium]
MGQAKYNLWKLISSNEQSGLDRLTEIGKYIPAWGQPSSGSIWIYASGGATLQITDRTNTPIGDTLTISSGTWIQYTANNIIPSYFIFADSLYLNITSLTGYLQAEIISAE